MSLLLQLLLVRNFQETNNPKQKLKNLLKIFFAIVLLASCRSAKLAEGEHYLGNVAIETGGADIKVAQLMPYVRQTGASGLTGSFTKKSKKNIFSLDKAESSRKDISSILNNIGYMQAVVKIDSAVNEKGFIDITYDIEPGKRLYVDSFNINVADKHLDSILRINNLLPAPSIFEGKPFNATALNNERKRITDFLLENGYSHFNKDFISIDADTLQGSDKVWMTMNIEKYRENSRMEPIDHPVFHIGKITWNCDFLRQSVLENNTMFESGGLFRYSDLQNTYNRFGRLGAIRSTQVVLKENSETGLMDADIHLHPNLPNSLSFMPEGTNTSGNLGAAATLTYSNKNFFHGSETFSIHLRGAYEAIRGLEGYSDNDYKELGAEAKIEFPRLLAPFVKKSFKRENLATSELSVSYNMQDRPEFRRRLFRGAWRYKWNNKTKSSAYTFDLLDLNFISMPKISDTFRETYLDGGSKKNAILRYNYEDLFIMKTGINMSYKGESHAFRVALETAGNLLGGIAKITDASINSNGQRKVLGIAFAQYVKFDFDYTKIFPLKTKTDLALHTDFGIAWPYGNSNILPFEKRYFSGGANSVRGWSVRGLGPGRFRSTDGAIDFINQTGGIKLDLNAELRGPLFWKFNYAVFVDAGNIWTLRDYEDQPGGQFKFNTFLEEIAVAYGAGIRLNFDYFTIRFDGGMKAINPAYTTNSEHWAIFHPQLKRDFTLHFAVGLPF